MSLTTPGNDIPTHLVAQVIRDCAPNKYFETLHFLPFSLGFSPVKYHLYILLCSTTRRCSVSGIISSTIGVIFGANFKKIPWDLLVNKGISGSSEKMLGAGEPSA